MNFLEHIVGHKEDEVARRKRERSAASLGSLGHYARATVPLARKFGGTRPFGIIAEVKRASPSAGMFGRHLEPASLAAEYAENGAAGISVLTDERFFHGSLDDLARVRQCVALPVLRKDFIVDEYQLHEAKAYGADAVLLIAAILDQSRLADLAGAAASLGLECLVELYDAREMNKLDFDVMTFVGINNRDLRTFQVDLYRTFEIKRNLPANVTVISESGIRFPEEIVSLRNGGVHGALIGESLVTSDSPGATLRDLLRGNAPAR